ncbi:hypothetical protein BDZ94DRAFT_1245356 [Collybia nuda]|uniref:Uncharacterized protein n=1 Tax=Collybia nuda TaxID=64659 RepID=A0A9P5YI67_9AGAR|nr:hypothetical protein BDZ94DRAFT_1245356 [Collybia nuda]
MLSFTAGPFLRLFRASRMWSLFLVFIHLPASFPVARGFSTPHIHLPLLFFFSLGTILILLQLPMPA